MLPVRETTVGDFLTTPGDEFQVPDSCGGHTVTHTNANIKALHTRFLWQAPKGTGTVKFRVLIKQGEQNKVRQQEKKKIIIQRDEWRRNCCS